MELDDCQIALLRAALDRIVPADEVRGACACGVDRYVVRLLATDGRDLAPLYAAGLEALDVEAQARCGAGFAALPAGLQDLVLTSLETGDVLAAWAVPAQHFFELLCDHAAEGFYGAAAGAEVSWPMIGFPLEPSP